MAGARLEQLSAPRAAAVADLVGRLKHDLGKYVALQQRWLPQDAGAEARREALSADLLATRRGPGGAQDALSVWQDFRDGLTGACALAGGERVDLSDDDDVAAIDAAMSVLATIIGSLRAGAATDAQVQTGLAAADEVATCCRRLHQRARGRS